MINLHRHLLLTTALVLSLSAAAPLALTPVQAAPETSASDPGFKPDTGQINPGFDKKNPSSEAPRKIPSQEEARSALLKRDAKNPNQPSIGDFGTAPVPATDAMRTETRQGQTTAGGPQATNASSDVAHNGSQGNTNTLNNGKKDSANPNPSATSGAGGANEVGKPMNAGKQDSGQAQADAQPPVAAQPAPDPAAQDQAMKDQAARAAQQQAAQAVKADGPIGSTSQTMPSKLSERNDILDRMPTMAMPLPLSEQDRQKIYQAVMADKSQASMVADSLNPADELPIDLALTGTHPLPSGVQGIASVSGLHYVKAKDKVLLVDPATRIVVDAFAS